MDNNYSNTVFDDVFRTIFQKLPNLIIPLVNEVFKTSFEEHNAKLVQLRNERFSGEKKTITDSILQINDKLYHIECQSGPDSHMALRMFEYDAMIAIENADKIGNCYVVNFPSSAVMYLRTSYKMGEKIKVLFPDGQNVDFEPRRLFAKEYSLDEMFQKDLFVLLPYYMMRYEEQFESFEANDERRNQFIVEMDVLNRRLSEEMAEKQQQDIYVDLCSLIKRISDYLLQKYPKTQEGVDSVMGGTILKTYTEEVFEKGAEKRSVENYYSMLAKDVPEPVVRDGLGITDELLAKYPELKPKQ